MTTPVHFQPPQHKQFGICEIHPWLCLLSAVQPSCDFTWGQEASPRDLWCFSERYKPIILWSELVCERLVSWWKIPHLRNVLRPEHCMHLLVAVHTSLKSIHDVLTLERERVRQAWTGPDLRQNTSQQLATLCSTLTEVALRLNWTQ